MGCHAQCPFSCPFSCERSQFRHRRWAYGGPMDAVNLYWVITDDHDEDWFARAWSSRLH